MADLVALLREACEAEAQTVVDRMVASLLDAESAELTVSVRVSVEVDVE